MNSNSSNPIESKQKYQEYVNKKSPNSPIWKNCFNAFWVGGLICTIGQIISNICKARCFDTAMSGTIVSPAMEYKSEGYVMGVGGKMFTVAGPVLVFGISASIIVGLVYLLFNTQSITLV